MYLPRFRCLYFLGETQPANDFALWPLRLSWHSKPVALPLALNSSFALWRRWLIFALVIWVFGGGVGPALTVQVWLAFTV